MYILGTLALFVVFLFLYDFLSPGTIADAECGLLGFRCWVVELTEGEKTYASPPQMQIDTKKDYVATIKTTVGDFEIDLYEKNAPKTVNNFVFLAEDDYYDGVLFHRVINDFLIQTGDRNTLDGDPENDGNGGPGYTIGDEVNWDSLDFSQAKRQQLRNAGYSTTNGITSKHLEQKSLAMANSEPDSNGSQFFIVTATTQDPAVKNIEGKHTVFGKVVSGWDVVQQINGVEVDSTDANSPTPTEEIEIIDILISVQ